MANPEQLAILKQGVEVWNQWRKEHSSIRPDLSHANLAVVNLLRLYSDEEGSIEGANLNDANLTGANLMSANLEGAFLIQANLEGADLQEAVFDAGTNLRDVVLGDGQTRSALVADLTWGGANLAVVNWTKVKMLGDEYEAQRPKTANASFSSFRHQIGYRTAVRATRQLAVVLRDQGLNEEADYFAYRAQRLQRIVLRHQRKFGRYLFSLFLDLLAGYGYRPGRSVIAYLLIIFGFMCLYLLNAHFVTPHLRWDEALVLSVSSFHGRGFFSQDISLGDTYARLASVEAVIGLLIEISFIATFTQRFFGR